MQDPSPWYGATHVGGGGSLETMCKEWMKFQVNVYYCQELSGLRPIGTIWQCFPLVCMKMLPVSAKARSHSLLLPQDQILRRLPVETAHLKE